MSNCAALRFERKLSARRCGQCRAVYLTFLVTFLLLLTPVFFQLAPVRAEILAAFSEKTLSTRKIVLEEVEKLVAQFDVKIGVVGSAVKGNYLDPLLKSVAGFSDVDMTMIIEGVDDEAELFRRWTAFHKALKQNIGKRLDALVKSGELQKAYGANLADDFLTRVTNSVNIYPPDQLMAGVEDVEEYQKTLKGLFEKYGISDSHHVNLGEDAFDAIAGEGGMPFRQHYEATNGVVFEMFDGEVIHGFHDLQEVSKFTDKGVANISQQFLAKSRKALAKGEGAAKDLSKNLKRLNQYLKKAKSMAGVDAASIANPEIDDLLRKLDAFTAKEGGDLEKAARKWYAAYGDEIGNALMTADVEARTCQAIFATVEETEKALLRNLIQSSRWQRFKNALGRFYRRAVDTIPISKIAKGMMVLAAGAEYLAVRDVYAEQGLDAAARYVALEVIFSSLPATVARMAFEMAMEHAKSYGYQLAVSRQSCDDFLAGIVAIMGAEKFQKGYERDEFARLFIHEDEAHEKLVYLAGQAAVRSDVQTNSAVAETEAGKAAELLKKCEEPIMDGWRATRRTWFLEAATSANRLRNAIEPLTLALDVVKNEPGPRGTRLLELAIRPIGDAQAIYAGFQKLDEQIRRLGGRDGAGELVVDQTFNWTIDGKRVSPEKGGPEGTGTLTLSDFERDGLFGHGASVRIALPDSNAYTLGLNYRLVFQSKLSIAPEIMNNVRALWGGYRKTGVLPVDPPHKSIAISGPTEVAAGETAYYSVTLADTGANADKLAWSVVRKNAATPVGYGKAIQIPFDQPGRVTITAELPGGGDEFPVTVFQPAQLSFDLTDAGTGRPITHADIVMTGNYKDGRTYRIGEADDLGSGLSIIPGPYDYRIAAKGYATLFGATTIGFGAPRLAFEMEKSDETPASDADGTSAGALDPNASFVGLSFDHRELVLEPGKQGYVKVSAMAWERQQVRLLDVTGTAEWESADPDIATVEAGVVTAGKTIGETLLTARFAPPDGSKVLVQTIPVTIKDLSTLPPEADFAIAPDASSYRVGQELTFTQTVPPPNDDLEFTWYLDGETLNGPQVAHAFTDQDRYTVALVVRSRASGLEQRFSRSITVRDADAPRIDILADPAPPYPNAAEIVFSLTGPDLPDPAEFRWLVDGKLQSDTGRTTGAAKLEPGAHHVRVFVVANGDEHYADLDVDIGASNEPSDTGMKADARWRNSFANSEPDENGKVEISSQYWIGGDGRWSDPRIDTTIDVEGPARLVVGEQADGYNTGFLVYVPKGRNELRYAVYHYDFSQHRLKTAYSGTVPLHGETIDPSRVEITETHARAIAFRWHSTTGSLGLLRLHKFPAGGSVTGGLEELDFIKGSGAPATGLDGIFGSKTIDLGDQGSTGDGSQPVIASGRPFEALPQNVKWSAPAGQRAYIQVENQNNQLVAGLGNAASSMFGSMATDKGGK